MGGFTAVCSHKCNTDNLFELGSLWKAGVVLYVEILLRSEATRSEKEDVVTGCQQIFVRRHFENLNVFKMLGACSGIPW